MYSRRGNGIYPLAYQAATQGFNIPNTMQNRVSHMDLAILVINMIMHSEIPSHDALAALYVVLSRTLLVVLCEL